MVVGVIVWTLGDNGWLVSEQGGVALFVAEESGGWVFWASRRVGRRQEYAALLTGLRDMSEAKAAAEEWLSGHTTARPGARPR